MLLVWSSFFHGATYETGTFLTKSHDRAVRAPPPFAAAAAARDVARRARAPPLLRLARAALRVVDLVLALGRDLGHRAEHERSQPGPGEVSWGQLAKDR